MVHMYYILYVISISFVVFVMINIFDNQLRTFIMIPSIGKDMGRA